MIKIEHGVVIKMFRLYENIDMFLHESFPGASTTFFLVQV
jgi:hypothetical protein